MARLNISHTEKKNQYPILVKCEDKPVGPLVAGKDPIMEGRK